jgi:hypothetical protein
MNGPTSEPVRPGLNGLRWLTVAVGGFFLTALGSGIGGQLVMSMAVPGPAAPYAAAVLGIAGLSLVVSTLIMGRLVGVNTPSQWIGALVAVALPVVGVVALVALSLPRE